VAETSNKHSPETKPKRTHRVRTFILGALTAASGLILLDAHEVKDPESGLVIVGVVDELIEDMTGRENVYIDWVDAGAMVITAIGGVAMLEAIVPSRKGDSNES
jgi:hypothetical protein